MSKVDDGGPAFPVVGVEKLQVEDRSIDRPIVVSTGVSVRDYFAAKALSDVMRDWRESRQYNPPTNFETDAPEVARDCYLIADAMLAARKAPQ